jgi:plastocyanin
MMRRSAFALLLVATVSACATPVEPPPASTTPPPVAAPASASAASGTITGKGPAPGPGGAVVIVLEPKGARTFPPQSEKPVMDQAGLTFGPELLIVRTGQPVEFHNSDDTLHNVRVSSEETGASTFNVAIPTGESYTHTFERDGFYRVGCDIHPAMAASVFASTSPYATLAEGDGGFGFADVPAGEWTVTVYAGGKQLRKTIDVTGGVTSVAIP